MLLYDHNIRSWKRMTTCIIWLLYIVLLHGIRCVINRVVVGGIPADVGDDKLLLMHHKKIDNIDIGVRCIGTFMLKIDPMKWYNININSELYFALSNKKA